MKGLYEIINTTLKVHERANFGDEKARDIITKIMCKKVVLLMKSQGYEVDYSGMNHIHNLLKVTNPIDTPFLITIGQLTHTSPL